jgi:hypothetical protein
LVARCCPLQGVSAIAILGVVVGAPIGSAKAKDGPATMTCTNPSSGTTWQIRIDYDRGTVDSFPATISAAEISWRDTRDAGNYTLDRKSGHLRVAVPSSTGGYFLHDQCKLDQ